MAIARTSQTAAEAEGRVTPHGRRQALPSEVLERLYDSMSPQLDRVKESMLALANGQAPYLTELLDHVLDAPGKRLRPALTLMASRFHPNDGHNVELMAGAVELLHIATLIHDDTVDNSDIRHGKATVSSLWGRNAAVLIGDYIFAASATLVCDTGNIRVIRRFAETIMELSSGELHEIAVAFDHEQTKERYFRRIYDKTASLFTTAAESGALLSGAREEQVQALKRYGKNLGMAFQIVDDILDVDGTQEETGKPVGADLAQGIMTLPIIVALEHNPGDNPVAALFRTPGDGGLLEQAVELVQAPSVIEESYAEADRFGDAALGALSELAPGPARESLEQLAGYVVRRRS